MITLIKFAMEYIRSAMPNRKLLKTASPEAKANIIRRMTLVLIYHDRFINDEYVEVNGCTKLKRRKSYAK